MTKINLSYFVTLLLAFLVITSQVTSQTEYETQYIDLSPYVEDSFTFEDVTVRSSNAFLFKQGDTYDVFTTTVGFGNFIVHHKFSDQGVYLMNTTYGSLDNHTQLEGVIPMSDAYLIWGYQYDANINIDGFFLLVDFETGEYTRVYLDNMRLISDTVIESVVKTENGILNVVFNHQSNNTISVVMYDSATFDLIRTVNFSQDPEKLLFWGKTVVTDEGIFYLSSSNSLKLYSKHVAFDGTILSDTSADINLPQDNNTFSLLDVRYSDDTIIMLSIYSDTLPTTERYLEARKMNLLLEINETKVWSGDFNPEVQVANYGTVHTSHSSILLSFQRPPLSDPDDLDFLIHEIDDKLRMRHVSTLNITAGGFDYSESLNPIFANGNVDHLAIVYAVGLDMKTVFLDYGALDSYLKQFEPIELDETDSSNDSNTSPSNYPVLIAIPVLFLHYKKK